MLFKIENERTDSDVAVAFCVERVSPKLFANPRGQLSQLICQIGFMRQRTRGDFLGYTVELIFLDEIFNGRSLLIHYAVNAEIEFSTIELEKLP